MVKAVFKLELPDEKTKKRAMKTVSGFSGVDSISIDTKDNKLIVTGDFNPVNLVSKLRKLWPTDILSVEPAKEAEKKEEAKKEEPKKQGGNKKDTNKDDVAELVKAYKAYNPYLTTHYYVHSAEENPNSCVIC